MIAFDSVPWQIVDTGPIKDKTEVLEKIRSVSAGGGTDIFTPAQQAYSQLEPLELKRKHIILLTDGQSATSINYRDMIEQGKEAGISLSTVAISLEADGPLLEEMAELGGGRFYQVTDESSIPTILSRETALMTRTYIEDNPFVPNLVNGYEWSSYFQQGIPQVNAYVATSPKQRAQQILVSEKDDPLLISWQYGLGKTAAWTSDLTGEWAGDWPGDWPAWQSWSPLWNEIVSWTFPQYENKAYQVEKSIEGNEVTLSVTAPDQELASIDASLVNEDGGNMDISLQAKAPGEYQGTFTAENPGVYFLQITERENEEVTGFFKTGVVVPYSQEYAFSGKYDQLIEAIAAAGGGRVVEEAGEVFSDQGIPPNKEKQDIFYLLLVMALVLMFSCFITRGGRFEQSNQR
ncbi:VWA domain-containing protein [Bacillaceae bacterium Marseille-Q3522]|nr:VWA domain-containing protein [Bacillaceae bacterium Marseille-Q3522]